MYDDPQFENQRSRGYENAPSTKMLATECCVCGKALRDAVSVDLGIGPDCRQKYGYNAKIDQGARDEDKLIHAIACNREGSDVPAQIERVKALGLRQLADTLADRVASVRIDDCSGGYAVRAPYSEALVYQLRSVPGRQWDAQSKTTRFPAQSKNQLWSVIKAHFSGAFALLPSGVLHRI